MVGVLENVKPALGTPVRVGVPVPVMEGVPVGVPVPVWEGVGVGEGGSDLLGV